MKPWVDPIRTEKGVALPLALFVLVMLSVFLLAFLSMGSMEPQISRNLNDTTRARYLADAGIEWAFDALATAPSINALLAANGGALATNVALPGLAAQTFGTFSVTVRNDNQAGDTQITGVALDPGNNTTDNNNIIIVTATGTYNGVARQIQVVRSGPSLSMPSAVYEPNVDFLAACCGNTAWGGGNWKISGNDTNLDGTPGAGAAKPGIGYTDPSNVADALSTLGGKVSKVEGGVADLTPVPSDMTVPALTALFNQLAAKADKVLTAGVYPSGGGSFTKPDGSPQITLADLSAGGQLKMVGSGPGKGILLVKGAPGSPGPDEALFAMDGTARFEGLIIICCSNREYDAEIQGNSQVFGGMINFSTDPTKKSLLNIENSAEILRSVQGLAYAQQLLADQRGRLWSWREL